ncbi:MAG TPA: sulfatase-like hydrolase/transferase [Candidatus Acidoferrum sp.]|jgi:arylsulfatase A-like enzyme/Flp pilus assembly protein TadD|nr:sulfatase-like hydrolase/transferase [Candidatus Acidoferrum sp.]
MFSLWRFVFLLLGSFLLVCCELLAQLTPAPNVVVITIDTLRADHLGCYGDKQIRTPNIDALASEGIRFERAYTPVPVTLPAHTVIFTGTYPMLSGMHDFSGNKLSPGQSTLASILKQHGYTTGAVLGSAVLDSRFGLNQGFDFYYDHFDFSRLQESNLEEMERPGNVVADVALDWLAKNRTNKFFLWMHLYDPHYPYRPPSPYSEQYKDRPYDGEIAFADAQVGRLVTFLKTNGLYRNTVIVLAGDHGESLGEHGEKNHGFFIYNATLHVPVIMHLPGSSSLGVVSALVSLADLMPTVLKILKVETPSQVQGLSLLPLMARKKTEERRSLYAETFLPRLHFNWSELRSVETEKYHFIDAPKPELYDLSKDPSETQNLYAEKKAVADEMRARLTTQINQYSAGPELAQKTGLDPALMERLKSLGYAGFSGGGNPTITDRSLPDPKDRIQTYELISDAIAESQHGQYQSSTEKLTAALKTDPDSVPVHYLLGLDYYRLHDFPRAVQELQRVLQLSPDYALAVFNLGLAYARTGDFDRAIQELKHALDLDGTNFSAAYNLGAAYGQKQMVPEAVAAFRQTIAIAPEYAPGHRALGELLLYQGQVDESLAELRRAADLDPRNAGVHAALAKALSAKGLNAEAEVEMRKAQQSRPQ